MLLLGFASGAPFGVLAEPLTAWLAESGTTKTAIGLFALVSLPYSAKVLWAPVINRAPIPLLTKRFGRRRGWVLLTQAALILALVGLGQTDPRADLALTAALALAVSFASVSQDVVIDAYRVEILARRALAAGAATAVFGWRLGQVAAAAGGLIAAEVLPWPTVFLILAATVLAGTVAILVMPEPTPPPNDAESTGSGALAWLRDAVVAPLADMIGRPQWLTILLFIMLYKFGDAVLAVMKVPFFLELGFSKAQIAEVVKVFGVAATIGGGFLGGLVVARMGIMSGLLVAGLMMAGSNLVFVLLAWAGPDPAVLAATIAVENVATGMGTTAFVAYLSSLCTVAYTATQYALLTSVMAFARTVLSSSAGWLADNMDWISFFVLTTVAAIPGLLLLVWMMRRPPPSP